MAEGGETQLLNLSDSHLHTEAPACSPTINKHKTNRGLSPLICVQLWVLPVFTDVTERPCFVLLLQGHRAALSHVGALCWGGRHWLGNSSDCQTSAWQLQGQLGRAGLQYFPTNQSNQAQSFTSWSEHGLQISKLCLVFPGEWRQERCGEPGSVQGIHRDKHRANTGRWEEHTFRGSCWVWLCSSGISA